MPPDAMLIGEMRAQIKLIAERQEALAANVAAIRKTMDAAEGGVKVLRWFGFGSLASFIAGAAAIWHYLRGLGN